MNKPRNHEFLRCLKLFCVTFVMSTIVYAILGKVFYPQRHIDLSLILMSISGISMGSTIGYFIRYKKYTTKVFYEDVTGKDIITELQKIMKKMHWSIKKDGSEKIIFKSSVFITSVTEYLVVTINENDLELVGPQYYVEKVVKKLKA